MESEEDTKNIIQQLSNKKISELQNKIINIILIFSFEAGVGIDFFLLSRI